jgi:DNA repair exonuclease SbcCD ATPase subunit
MPLVERPDMFLYAQWSDEWAETKNALQKIEWELERYVAACVREAIDNKVKGTAKSVDVAKIIGNTDEQEHQINELKQEVFTLKGKINKIQAKMRTWEAAKDLYQTDSYHTMRGSIKTFGESED